MRQHTTAARAAAHVAAAGLIAGAVIAGCGSENAMVGGSCGSGYTQCDLECVDLANDPANCGSCGHACAAGAACVNGACPASGDASSDAGATDATASSDVATFDATDAGDATDALAVDAGDACTPPYDNAAHCGDCATVCSGVNDTCKELDNGFSCVPLCDAPLVRCGAACIDEQSDPNNCGACGRLCASNICTDGVCQGAANGDVIYIGHDYVDTPYATAQSKVFSNAILLAQHQAIRVLVYRRYAANAALGTVAGLLSAMQEQSGRSITPTYTATDADIPSKLLFGTYDVLLVLDERDAPAGALAQLGAAWATTLAAFTHAGGVFVTLDGAAGTTAEMPQFESATGLLSIASHTSIPAGTVQNVIAATDALGVGVVSPFATRNASTHFATEPNGGNVSYVAVDRDSGEPHVVHKIAP